MNNKEKNYYENYKKFLILKPKRKREHFGKPTIVASI
jgi:hypothetical protein